MVRGLRWRLEFRLPFCSRGALEHTVTRYIRDRISIPYSI